MEGNKNIPIEIIEEAKGASLYLLPEKSKDAYEKLFTEFNDWREKRGVTAITEDVLLSLVFYEPNNTSEINMTFLKVLNPFARYRKLFFESRQYLILNSAIRCKSGQESINAVSKTVNSEVDTNIKPLGEKVKETTKTASYMGVILLGVGVTATLFYAVFSELFSSKSPNNVYTKAVKRCINDTRVEDKLGYPITAYGEETRRGRRQHVSHLLYEKDGIKHLRMKFYLQGSRNKGTVQLDMTENSSGNYEYRFLFVEVNDFAGTTILIEDNRNV